MSFLFYRVPEPSQLELHIKSEPFIARSKFHTRLKSCLSSKSRYTIHGRSKSSNLEGPRLDATNENCERVDVSADEWEPSKAGLAHGRARADERIKSENGVDTSRGNGISNSSLELWHHDGWVPVHDGTSDLSTSVKLAIGGPVLNQPEAFTNRRLTHSKHQIGGVRPIKDSICAVGRTIFN